MASRAVPVPGPTAEQGVRAAMVDQGTWVAMSDQGTPWAMADQGSWANLFSWGGPQPLGEALEARTLGGRSGSDSVSSWNGAGSGADSVSSWNGAGSGADSVSSWNRVGSGERSGSTDSQARSGSADSRGALTLGESWAEPAGVLESTCEELALEGTGEERALKPGSNTSPHMPPTSPGAHEHL